MRTLAGAAAERHCLTPDVPSFQELGIGFVTGDWRAVYGPPGIPADRRAFIEKLMLDTMSDPEFKASAERVGFVITPLGTAGTMAEIKKWDDETYPVLQEAGLGEFPPK